MSYGLDVLQGVPGEPFRTQQPRQRARVPERPRTFGRADVEIDAPARLPLAVDELQHFTLAKPD